MLINRIFSHEGYMLKNQPKNMVEELEKIIEIKVNVYAKGS